MLIRVRTQISTIYEFLKLIPRELVRILITTYIMPPVRDSIVYDQRNIYGGRRGRRLGHREQMRSSWEYYLHISAWKLGIFSIDFFQ